MDIVPNVNSINSKFIKNAALDPKTTFTNSA